METMELNLAAIAETTVNNNNNNMNKNSKARAKQERKDKKHFHGSACVTSFWVDGVRNKNTKRKSPWRGASAANKKSSVRPENI